jgi:hypothetical protein
METIGLITVAWGGYGRFLPEWLEYINKSTVKPHAVTIVLGIDHGADVEQLKRILPTVKIITDNEPDPNYGRLANLAIKHTYTEWIMPFDADDLLLPDALSVIRNFQHEADYLCIAWKVHWAGKLLYRASPTPRELAMMKPAERSKRRINNNSPFRKSLWMLHPYEETNWMNINFVSNLVESDARFVQVRRACIVYRQWGGSMAKSKEWLEVRPAAIAAVKDMYKRLEKYYGR